MTAVQELMSTDVCTVPFGTSVTEAARQMRDRDIGDVLVLDDDGLLAGIVTDRDIAVRAVADGADASTMTVDEICSNTGIVSVAPDDPVERAVEYIRESAVRRLPVVDGGRPVGIVSLGDLAIELDRNSALADISQEPPNN